MQENEINQQLQKDHERFLAEPYNKNVPENILDLFEKSIMVLPPQVHGISFHKVKSIISKTPEQLSNSDIADVLKIVLNVSLERLYDSLYIAIPEQVKIEKFVLKFNEHIEKFKKELNQKRETLRNLSDGVLKTNGMRIIPSKDY